MEELRGGADRPRPAVAVDIGATKIATALIAGDGTILSRVRMDTRTAAPRIAEALCELVVRAAEPVGLAGVAGIGVSSAGPLDLVAGAVTPVNIPELRGVAFLRSLAELVPGRPTRLTGDGLAAAAGEHWTGAGQGCADLLAIVVSTGVGGGLVLGGRLHGGDGSAVEAFERGGRILGAMIANCAATCDLRRVIVGGGVAQVGELLMAPLRRSVAEHAVLPFTAGLEVVPARLGTDASLVGSAALIHHAQRYAGNQRVAATVVAG